MGADAEGRVGVGLERQAVRVLWGSRDKHQPSESQRKIAQRSILGSTASEPYFPSLGLKRCKLWNQPLWIVTVVIPEAASAAQ